MHRKTLLGLFGILGIWLTASVALPLVNVLTQFSPEQLMFVRGLITSIMALLITKTKVGKPGIFVLISGAGFAGGCLGVFHSIREMGASPSLICLTLVPLVNFSLLWSKGKRPSRSAVRCLLIMVVGVVIALEPWANKTNLTTTGLLWSFVACVSAGIYYEGMSRAVGEKLQKVFWQAVIISFTALAGVLMSTSKPTLPDLQTSYLLLGFAFVGGFLYILANIMAFENLPIDVACVLAQGETPMVILASGIILKEELTLVQWLGVLIAMYGAGVLSAWIAKQSTAPGKTS